MPHIPALVQYLIVDKPLGSTRIGNNSRTIIFQQNKTPSSSSGSSWLMRLIAKSMDIPSLCLVGMLNPYRISTFFNHHYVHLKILRPNLSFLMDSFSLASPATLVRLEFHIRILGIILRLETLNDAFYELLRDLNAWNYLESITTHRAGSRLRRVGIHLYYGFYEEVTGDLAYRDKVLKALLDGLPLLRRKGILFVIRADDVA